MKKKISAYLRRSQFILGLVRSGRGLARDLQVLVWLAERDKKIANY
jgi:hypothetical protein